MPHNTMSSENEPKEDLIKTKSKSRDQDPSDSADSLEDLIEKKRVETCLDIKCTLVDECGTTYDMRSSRKKSRSFCCNAVVQCVWGILLLLISIGGFIFTPLDFMLWEKLNMRPGFPPFDWWSDPPDEVKLRVHVFNVTNHERFLSGEDAKINMQEIGPIVYLEKLLHSNVTFNENSTMTYTATRYPVFLPELNHVDLNATIIVPNLAVLGISSYLHDSNYLVRTGFRLMANTYNSKVFVKKTIYEYLWDYRDPVLATAKTLVPGLVPVDNMGMLARIYADFVDEVTVLIGPQWGHNNFFQIDRFRGAPQLPGFNPDTCPDRIFGSTEGVMYHQHLTKNDVVKYWRKSVCKIMPLYFDTEMVVDDIPVYRYNLSESVYERVKNGTDCYDTDPSLPAGLSDGSKCYYDFPMVISYPHFYTGQPPKDAYVTGLQPDRYKHNSYVVVEPISGIPLRSVARMQSNLRIHDLSGFSWEYNKFSNLVLPLFWAEYNQEGLPPTIYKTIYYMIVVLPVVSHVVLTLILFIGSYFIVKNIYKQQLNKETFASLLQYKSKSTKSNNIILTYEQEPFLKGTR